MNKQKKTALSTGADNNGNPLYYYCTECGRLNLLNAKRCQGCNAKRPQDAFEHAVIHNNQLSAQNVSNVQRVASNSPTPVNPCYASPANGGAITLPEYYSTDEYGRVFKTRVFYGSLPCAGPVPIPTPSKTIQVSSINTPIN